MAKIEGKVIVIIFNNAENGYKILKIQGKQTGATASLVGVLPDVYEGQEFEATGTWSMHETHGRQFEVNTYNALLPTGLHGVIKYLSSDAFPGMGPVTAQTIAITLGDRIFEDLGDPAKLMAIPGISAGKAANIALAWEKQKGKRDVMIWLYSHGVKPAAAEKIYDLYGKNTVESVTVDPYRVASEIDGIGFLTADAIGRAIGLTGNHPSRILAGVNHVLSEATKFGHCGIPKAVLLASVSDLLELGEDPSLDAQVSALIQEGELIEDKSEAKILCVFNPKLYRQENAIAAALLRRYQKTPEWAPAAERIAGLIADAEVALSIKLAPEQQQAVRNALTYSVSVVTGGPGTGKTTLVKVLAYILSRLKINFHLAAPTGKAAIRLGTSTGVPAATVHKLLQLGAGRKTCAPGGLLILDESSMLDVTLTSTICEAANEAQQIQKFMQALLFIGDVDQLPSVGPGKILADMLKSEVIPATRLNQVFRQGAGSRIVEVAHEVNSGNYPTIEAGKQDRDFLFVEAKTPEQAKAELIKSVTVTLPAMGISLAESQVLIPMRKGSLGTNEINQVLKGALNPTPSKSVHRFGKTFSIGDKVMQTVNDYKLDVFNGEVGIISEIDELAEILDVKFSGRTVQYRFAAINSLILAYATTIHKFQGSEEKGVVMLLSTQHYPMLQRNLLYTGLTRARAQLILIGSKKAITLAVKQANSSVRHTRLNGLLLEGGQMHGWAGTAG